MAESEELDEEDQVCSICWEEFKTPKMLRCGHTFCKPCLKGYLKKSEDTDITCPLCRQKQPIINHDLDQLLDNYFVTLKPPEPAEKLCCSICFEETELKPCSHCTLKLCPLCKSSHRLALKLSDDKYDLSSDSGSDVMADESDDADITDEGNLPFHLTLSGQTIKTKFNASLVSSFQIISMVSLPEEGQQNFVSTIHPVENGLCEIVTNLGPECILYDSTGEELQREFFDNGITDIIDIEVDKKVISNFHLSMLLEIVKGKGAQLFSRTGNVLPTAVGRLDDGQIVCVGPGRRQQDNPKSTMEAKERHGGALQFYDKYGKLLKEVTGNLNDAYFKFPIGMSINKSNNTICISDRDMNCVYIFRENGILLNRYTGGSMRGGLFLFQLNVFAPHPICHDNGGNIIVGNSADGIIHVLDAAGQFLGYVATANDLGLGNPSALRFDNENRLWLGDQKDGTIRIFEITSYNNSLTNESMLPIEFNINSKMN